MQIKPIDYTFIDEFLAYPTESWKEQAAKMLKEMEQAPAFGPTQIIMHPEIYDRWKHLFSGEETMTIKSTPKYPSEQSMGAWINNYQEQWGAEEQALKPVKITNPCTEINLTAGAGWGIPVSFSSGSYTSSASGKSSGAAAAVVQEAVRSTPKSTTTEQEEWLARTISDFEMMFGAQPLLIDLLRTRLMTLPGYQYVNPT